MFQVILIYFGSIISIQFNDDSLQIPPSYHIHFESKCCVQEVNYERIHGKETVLERLIPDPSHKTVFNWCEKKSIEGFYESSLWSKTILDLTQSQDPNDFASMVAEHSLKLIRKHYLREPGSGVVEAGRLPFNWATRVDPSLLIWNIVIR